MPLPKDIKAQLDAWKKGEGDFPSALDQGSFFEDESKFLEAAGKRFDGKVRTAEKTAREAAVAEIFRELNIQDQTQIADLKERLEASSATATEAQKLASEKKRLERELAKSAEDVKSLSGFKTEVLKDRAIAPHLNKVHPDFRELVRKTLSIDLTVDGDKVLGPDSKEPEALIEAMLKATPSLKAPEFREGSGTSGQPAKAKAGEGGKQQTNGADDKRTPVQKLGADLMRMHQERLSQSGGS